MVYHLKDIYPINCESAVKPISADNINLKMLNNEYYFSNDWISNDSEYWISSIPNAKSNMNILQIGVYEGRMTVFLHNHIFANKRCMYYCIDNFGYNENEYYERNMINMKYNSSIVKERFLHNTRKFKDSVFLIEGNFNASVVPSDVLFDMIILDTTDETMLKDVMECIHFTKPGCILYITYKIGISQMSKLKKILPNNCKSTAYFYKENYLFDRIRIVF